MGQVFSSLDDIEFNQLFVDFKYTAFRLETLQHYDVSYESREFSRFLGGERSEEFEGIRGWIDGTVAKAVANGKKMHRVHVVEMPLSSYIRFEFASAYDHTTSAGEEVRILPVRAGEWPEQIPRCDYWLFDSVKLVLMNYEDSGRFLSAEVVDDPAQVIRANNLRDIAVASSTPYQEFVAKCDV
ncbi:DUF6879 family protein [Umezawaea endophytica]|uniref:DUF6879 domain-containing protein n=1 Tax=Umezawaea endophytica TaxID=1654476 RepID=A0A9X2VW09_9PSEU|nr:DUF6879 family protein [Umezawaea endophytica]MCS7483876.1 hypothetical protein [Umezawaea endophytica]